MKSKLYFLFTLLSVAAIFTVHSCKKGETDKPDLGIWGSAKQVDISGRVLDESGNAVSGATVKAGNTTLTTDGNGAFYMTNVNVYEKLGYINVTKAGYFMGSRTFLPREGVNVLYVRMLAKNIVGNVSAVTGGYVQGEGVNVTFSGGSFVKDNSPYNGQVSVALNYINPESQFFAEEMPGNLLGVQNESSTGLTSYGMVAVELTDGNGNEVKIASGSTATVKFPVPISLQSSAPTEIDLWSFDETNGYWIHEGKATLQNGNYVASVSHFSFWNCDIPTSFVILNGRIIDASGNGIQGAKVTITSNTYGNKTDYSSSTGHFSGYVPNGEALNIAVEVSCSSSGYVTGYTAQIGPFSSATTLAPISVSFPSSTIVTGNVTDCNNNPLPNAYIVANGQVYFLTNGQFSFMACGTTVSIAPYATTPWANGQVQNLILTGGTYNVGVLQVCNSGNNTGTVTDIDGNIYGTVQIGNQWWMQENLKTLHYRDGMVIPNGYSNSAWASGPPVDAYANPNDNTSDAVTYGRHYNWYAVTDSHNICPTGWHLPTDAEFTQLTDYLGGESVAGGKMKALSLWTAPNTGADNSSGFSALPASYRYNYGYQPDLGYESSFWTATDSSATQAWYRILYYTVSAVDRKNSNKGNGYSVRCVKD